MKKYTEEQINHNLTVRKLVDAYLDQIVDLEREITCLTITYEEMDLADPRNEELEDEIEKKEYRLYKQKLELKGLLCDGIVF